MRREEQRIKFGSLNLLNPSDKTADGDAIDLRNWRVDQAGVLRAGDTFWRLGQAPNSAPINCVYKLDNFTTTEAFVDGVQYCEFGGYEGTQFALRGAFLVGAGTGLFLWANGSFYDLVTSGLSGNPLSIGVWNGFIWVMDSLQQLKINPVAIGHAIAANVFTGIAAAVSSWLPAVPATAITAVADTAGNGQLAGSYEYYVTFVAYNGSTPDDGAESAGGPAGSLVAVLGGVISILSLPFIDTFADGSNAIRLYRAGGSLSGIRFVKQFGSGLMPTGSWSSTELSSTYPANDAPWTDTFPDSVIASNPVMPTSSATGAPATPTSAPDYVGGFDVDSTYGLVGTYNYYETFVNSAGLETNPGPISADVTPTNGIVDLSSIALAPAGADVVKRRIYREGGTLGNAYQVVELEDNTTTTFVDTAPDLTLEENDIPMPTTNDPPPTGTAADSMGFVGPYFNYLLAWKNDKLLWSQDGIPLFPGSEDGSATGNWAPVGLPDDKIQCITLHSQVAAIYKQRTVWTIYGDVVSGELVQTGATCGIVGKNAVANCGTYDLALCPDGVYRFDMYQIHGVSDKISPVLMGQRWLDPGFSDIVTGERGQDLFGTPENPFIAFLNGTAILGNGGSSSGDIQGAAFLYHPASERWASITQNFGTALTFALPFGDAYEWFAGDVNGFLLMSRQLAGTHASVWQTPFFDFGLGDQPKYFQEVVLDMELNGATANVWLLFDNTEDAGPLSSVAAPYLASFTGTTRQKFYMPLGNDNGDVGHPHMSVRVEVNPLDPTTIDEPGNRPAAIHALYVYYGLEERDASIRATQVMDWHNERIALARKFEVDAVGPVVIAFETDEPSGLATRFTYTGPDLTARTVFEFPAPPNLRGRLWRATVTPDNATARVYALRGWMRDVGNAQESAWEWRSFIDDPQTQQPEAE